MAEDENVDPSIAVRDTAQRLLTRREHSRRELLNKLKLREVESSLACAVIDELEAEGLQSDQRFAEAFVRSRRSRLQGPLKIQSELQRRGVSKALINESLDPYSGEWVELATAFLRRRDMAGAFANYDEVQKVYTGSLLLD